MRKEKKWIIVILFYFITIVGIYTHDANISIEKVSLQQLKHDNVVGEIMDKNIICQSFISAEDNISSIELMFATYMRKNTGEVIFHLKDSLDSHNYLVSKTISVRELEDNRMYKINLGEVKVRKGKRIYMCIESPNGKIGNAITLWYDSKFQSNDSKLFKNSDLVTGNLKYNIYYKEKKGLNLKIH